MANMARQDGGAKERKRRETPTGVSPNRRFSLPPGVQTTVGRSSNSNFKGELSPMKYNNTLWCMTQLLIAASSYHLGQCTATEQLSLLHSLIKVISNLFGRIGIVLGVGFLDRCASIETQWKVLSPHQNIMSDSIDSLPIRSRFLSSPNIILQSHLIV
jgi:hypothetical protein